MNTTKAAYWIALAALALGLNSEYQHGKFPALHRAADRAGVAVCQLTARAEQTLATARLVVSQQAVPAVDSFASSSEMAEARAEMLQDQARDGEQMVRDQVRARAEILRAQAEIRRAQIEQIRVSIPSLEMSGAGNRRFVLAVPRRCAKPSFRIAIDGRETLIGLTSDKPDAGDMF